MKNMYIIAGCNGAGKTTAAYNMLPEILMCKEFVNADEIAKGLSPFQPETVTYQAGKIMSNRIQGLIDKGENFAVETTLSAITYKSIIEIASKANYFVNLIFFWLNSVELAKERVRLRVLDGGHSVPEPVIERRYYRGIANFFKVFLPICDNVMLFDNSGKTHKLIMSKAKGSKSEIYDTIIYNQITSSYVRG